MQPVLQITANLSRPLFIGLDRDGTLVPFSEHPEKSLVDLSVRYLLNELSELANTQVAIVSARSLKHLINDFGDTKLILAGNYGLEILFPGLQPNVQEFAKQHEPQIAQIAQLLAPLTNEDTGAILDHHGFSLCLHWHCAKKERHEYIHNFIESLAKTYNHLEFRKLPTSYEVIPRNPWNKASALEHIESKLNATVTMANPFYIFAGDSVSDESAFAWVNNKNGASIRIGNSSDPSHAHYRLPGVGSLHDFLALVLDSRTLKKKKNTDSHK
jgi:trehalose 6-phosphate phosphatase